jgi:hypothetical protein
MAACIFLEKRNKCNDIKKTIVAPKRYINEAIPASINLGTLLPKLPHIPDKAIPVSMPLKAITPL